MNRKATTEELAAFLTHIKASIEHRIPQAVDDMLRLSDVSNELDQPLAYANTVASRRKSIIRKVLSQFEQGELGLAGRVVPRARDLARAEYTKNTAQLKADRLEALKGAEAAYKRQCADIEVAHSKAMAPFDAELERAMAITDAIIPAVAKYLKEKRTEVTKLAEAGIDRVIADALALGEETRKAA